MHQTNETLSSAAKNTALALITTIALMMAGCSDADTRAADTTPSASTSDQSAAQSASETANIEKTIAVMETSLGVIRLSLDSQRAPDSVANFVRYANSGHYNGTIFHRVISNFMIQGGGFDKDMNQKATRAPIKNEADNGLKNTTGTIAMARTSAPHSATSQFFINVKDNANLDHRSKNAAGWGYAVFGEVIEGMDVVEAIRVVNTGRNGRFNDVPLQPVIIERVYIASDT